MVKKIDCRLKKNKNLDSCKKKNNPSGKEFKCWEKGVDNDWVNKKNNMRINTFRYFPVGHITILKSKNKKIKSFVKSDNLQEARKVEKDLMEEFNKC